MIMDSYTWEEYYEKIWEWQPSTMVKHMSKLSSFGPSEIESQVQDKISVQNTRLNMGKWIVFHDVYGDGFLMDWMVQLRIKKMIRAVEDAHKEVLKLKSKL